MKTKVYILSFLTLALFSCKNNVIKNNSEDTTTSEINTNNPDNAHNSKNSLDYYGTYSGVVPCADCEGIKTSITLLKDGTFTKSVQYLGKEDIAITENGNYTWNDEGSAISIATSPNETQMYKVGENVLFHLDKEGNRIEGSLAENYKLQKVMETNEVNEIENKKWVLVELLGKKISSEENSKQAFILLNSEVSKISGYNSCNNFNATYELKGENEISLGNMAVTRKACLDMTTSASFNEVLNKVDNYTIKDGVLSLNKAKMATLAKFKTE